jgi:hypothetical protein
MSLNAPEKIGREQGIIHPKLSFPIVTPKDEKFANFWQNFDGIYCLSLSKRKDRHDQAKRVFSSIICPVQFYLCEKGKYSPAYHISNAHSDVAQHAMNLGYKNILVFEDDVQLCPSINVLSLLRSTVSFIKTQQYHFFFLGCFPHAVTFRVIPTTFETIYEIQGGWSQWHAYILSRKGMETVSRFQLPKTAKQGLDCFFNSEPKRYAIFPMIFQQSSSPSNYVSEFGNQIKYLSSAPLTWWAFNIRINVRELLIIFIFTLLLLICLRISHIWKKQI